MAPHTPASAGQTLQPLRLWPGVAAAVVLVFTRLGLPIVWPEQTLASVLGGIAGGLLIIVWWTFFSRAPRSERWGALALIVLALAATWAPRRRVDFDRRHGWAAPDARDSAARRRPGALGGRQPRPRDWARRATMAATIVIACGVWTLAKTGGFSSRLRQRLDVALGAESRGSAPGRRFGGVAARRNVRGASRTASAAPAGRTDGRRRKVEARHETTASG